jgi:hypothetical protein
MDEGGKGFEWEKGKASSSIRPADGSIWGCGWAREYGDEPSNLLYFTPTASSPISNIHIIILLIIVDLQKAPKLFLTPKDIFKIEIQGEKCQKKCWKCKMKTMIHRWRQRLLPIKLVHSSLSFIYHNLF